MKKEEIEKKYKLVSLEWIDAQSDSDWCSPDKTALWADEDCVIFEIGWLVCESKKYIVITNQMGEDGDFGNRTKIPKKWIRKKEYVNLKVVHNGKRKVPA